MWDDFFFKNGRKLNDRMTIAPLHPSQMNQHYLTAQNTPIVSQPDMGRGFCIINLKSFGDVGSHQAAIIKAFSCMLTPAEHSWEKYTHSHTWSYNNMSSVNTAESVSFSCSSFKVFDIHLLAVDPCNGESPCYICVQPHPECYSHTGSLSEEQEGRISPKRGPIRLRNYRWTFLIKGFAVYMIDF